ncbi:hypothetical protein QQF64_008537 [Cirrhinus molitorella]|uniref:Uncharacterized protein n=1 Tax=Cirrhinus molitorella TaxID=172907 RepID=A0ABR3M7V3_9TELE
MNEMLKYKNKPGLGGRESKSRSILTGRKGVVLGQMAALQLWAQYLALDRADRPALTSIGAIYFYLLSLCCGRKVCDNFLKPGLKERRSQDERFFQKYATYQRHKGDGAV